MTSPFDPRNWMARRPGPDDAGPSWVDLWLDATTWWVEPATRAGGQAARAGTQVLSGRSPEHLLADLVDGLARQFSGQRVEVALHGHPTEGRLDSIRVFRTADRFEARVDVSDGDVDGVPIEHASVSVRSVRLEPGVPTVLRADGIEVAGRAHLEPLVSWLDGRVEGWTLGVYEGAVLAHPHDRRYRGAAFVVDGVVTDNVLHLELRGGRWRRYQLGLPRWLRLTKRIDIEPLSSGVVLEEARVRGRHVDFRVTQSSARGDLDLAALRDAVSRGTRVVIG